MSLSKHFSSQKLFPLILCDGLCVFFAFFIALAFRFDGHIPTSYLSSFTRTIPFVIFLYCIMNVPFGLYGHLWRYASAQEVAPIVGSTATSTAFLLLTILTTNTGRPIPLSVIMLSGFFTVGTFTAVRYRQRLLTGMMSRLQRIVGRPDRQRVLIVGAGEAGQLLAQQIRTHSQHHHYELVGFVDDDPAKLSMRVHGVPILGNRDTIPQLAAERNVSLIIIAIHSIPGPTLREILSLCLSTQARVKMMPDFLGRMDSAKDMLPLKDITPADLLGRQPCQIDKTACRELIADKIVLVTGAAGSIGSELCRQILDWQPRQLLMLDNNETGLHDLALTLKHHHTPDAVVNQLNENIVPLVADIRNQAKIDYVFETYRPQIVFHAAAYKHVPLMERQPDEAVRVNVLGTQIVSEAAARNAADRFVLISSDKAVNPGSIMGATKRVGEMLITNMSLDDDQPLPASVTIENITGATNGRHQQYARQNGRTNGVGKHKNGKTISTPSQNLELLSSIDSELALSLPQEQTPGKVNGSKSQNHRTRFTAVRFGNVLGSRGSVVPTFTRQIELGGPVTLTHPEMTRYFMSISEAVSLVIQAATLTEGNDIFMLDMGQEIRITDMAHKMIRLRGLRPGQDIAIEYIGIRPGEKLNEELLAPHEERLATSHPHIFRIRTRTAPFSRELLSKQVCDLIKLSEAQQRDKMVEVLWQLVQNRTSLEKPIRQMGF
jgi:FlaA1/EpsC-like NDP-sugar epimerase